MLSLIGQSDTYRTWINESNERCVVLGIGDQPTIGRPFPCFGCRGEGCAAKSAGSFLEVNEALAVPEGHCSEGSVVNDAMLLYPLSCDNRGIRVRWYSDSCVGSGFLFLP